MVRPLAFFLCAALVSAVFELALSGCLSSACECPATPELPTEKAPLPITKVHNYNAMGNLDPLPFDFQGSTIGISGKQVVIHYSVDGMDNQVTYKILPAQHP